MKPPSPLELARDLGRQQTDLPGHRGDRRAYRGLTTLDYRPATMRPRRALHPRPTRRQLRGGCGHQRHTHLGRPAPRFPVASHHGPRPPPATSPAAPGQTRPASHRHQPPPHLHRQAAESHKDGKSTVEAPGRPTRPANASASVAYTRYLGQRGSGCVPEQCFSASHSTPSPCEARCHSQQPREGRRARTSFRTNQEPGLSTCSFRRPPSSPTNRSNLLTQVGCQLRSVVGRVCQHPNRLILVAGPEIAVRPVATRALARDDAQ